MNTNKTVKENPIFTKLLIDLILYKKNKNIAYGIIDTANNNVLSIEPNFSINLKNKSFISLFYRLLLQLRLMLNFQ